MKKRSVLRLLTACTATSIAVSMTGSMAVKAAEVSAAENECVNSDNSNTDNGSSDNSSADSSSANTNNSSSDNSNTDNSSSDNSSANTDNGSADNSSANTENTQDNGSTAGSNNEGDAVTLSAAPANNTLETVETTTNVNEDGSITNTTTTTTVVTTVTEGDPKSVTETVEVQQGDAYYNETQKDSEGNEIHPEKAEVTTTSSQITTTVATTVATTVSTETATTSVVGWKTNAKDFSQKEVVTLKKEDNTVKTADASDAVETAAQNFLNSQNVAADYAVYADELNNSIDHIDGNIAVDTLGCSETIMNKEQYGTQTGSGNKDIALSYAQNGYSYVGKTEDGVQIRTNSCNQTVDGKAPSLLVYGEEAGESLKNNGNYTEENGTANHFGKLEMTSDMLDENGNLKEEAAKELVESDSRLDDLAKVMDIDNNRQAIAEAGQALIEATNESDTLTDLQKIEKTAEIINSDMVEKDQIITVTVGFSTLSSNNNWNEMNAALNKLVTDNRSDATVVVNVAPGTEDLDISINYQMDRTQNYNCRAANLFWNFGTYNGKITFTSGWSGNIVAPLAQVVLGNGIQSGRVIADTVSTRGEIHMAVADSTEETVKTVEITSRDESTSVETKSETKSETSYKLIYPELPKETDKTENPKNPEENGGDEEEKKDEENKEGQPDGGEDEKKDEEDEENKTDGGDEDKEVEEDKEKEDKTEGVDEDKEVEEDKEKEDKTESGGEDKEVEEDKEKEEKTEGGDEDKEVEEDKEKEEKTESGDEDKEVEEDKEKEEKTEGVDEDKKDDNKEENKKTDNKDSSDNDDNTHNHEESKGSNDSNGGSGNDGGKSTEVTTITITTPVVPRSVSFSSPEEANLMSLALATPGVPRSMKTGERSVQTGDDSNVILFGGMAAASLGALYVYIASRKKERE